jgi:hypothetical protein
MIVGTQPKFVEEDWLMKGKIIVLLAVGCLALTVAFVGGSAATFTAKAAMPAVTGVAATAAAANPAEPHPQIREAISAMRRAREHMEHAAHDFGGHRVEAIKATDVAIRQLEECLRYDRD